MKKIELKSKAAEIAGEVRRMSESGCTLEEIYEKLHGPGGAVSKAYPDSKSFGKFLVSEEYKDIMRSVYPNWDTEVLGRLKEAFGGFFNSSRVGNRKSECSGNFRVRVPRSLHFALIKEAEQEGVSLNQLVLTKLSVQLSTAVSQSGHCKQNDPR